MSVQIKINGVDKSTEIDFQSVLLNRSLTNQVDTLNFKIKRADSAGFKPALNDDIEVIEDSVTLFGGQIIEMIEEVDGMLEYASVLAKDYSFDMDRNLVVRVYQNMSIEDIIDEMATNILPAGYDTSNVVAPTVISYIAFNYEYPSKCLQQLAEISNSDWYVDKDKKIYFFVKSSQSAPFNLTDTNGNYIYSSLILNKNITNIRNAITVRGGVYPGSAFTEHKIADGTQLTFVQAYAYTNVVVTVGGVSQTVGVDNEDDPTLFDCLYNFAEKAVRFKSATLPAVSADVAVGGNPSLPVITRLVDSSSVALYGVFEYKIIDKTLNSKDAARDRARAETASWAQQINEGTFDTLTTGLDTGQSINITSANRSVNQDFIISRIASTMDTPTRFKHSATLVTSQTYGMVQFLQKLLINGDKQIVINEQEILDFITSFFDTFEITDSIGTPTNTTGPYTYGTSGSSDGRYNFSTFG
jgi:hypothetical protein